MIQDSTTGNIMGLRDGFVPVGMKEYGGILYIASYNQNTKEGELGTIPSPVINYTYSEEPYTHQINKSLTDGKSNNNSLIDNQNPIYISYPFPISDKRFSVGDQFIVSLNIGQEQHITREEVWTCSQNMIPRNRINKTKQKKGQNLFSSGIQYNVISGFRDGYKNYGLFSMVLEAKVERSADTLVLHNITDKQQLYYTENELYPFTSNYWFINQYDINDSLDIERCQADDLYHTYPNILPGYLYVRIQAELPENFVFFTNKSTGIKSPNIYLIQV